PTFDERGTIKAWYGSTINIDEQVKNREAQEFLMHATNVLSGSLDYHTTLQNLTQLVVPYLADSCAVHIYTDDGMVRRLAFAARDAELASLVAQRVEKYPLDPTIKHMVPYVLRTGTPELFSQVSDAMLQDAARDEA